jgi:fucose 4-O-acetylase-like acetyltransferase
MTRSLSQKFRFFTFVCIGLLAYVHGYNLNDTYLAPFSAVQEPLTFTSFFEYLFANGLLRFRIPMLFMISGYLYASYDHRPYTQQIKSRFRSLIIPYFLWSACGLLFTFLLQQLPYTAHIVYQAGIDQLGDNRPYTEIGWSGMAERFLLRPISYQLWFILALFFFNLIYPAIKWMVVRLPYIWLPFTFLLFFVAVINIPLIDFRGLFFFSFGVWVQKQAVSLEKEPRWFSLGLTMIAFVGLSVIKTFMAFELEPNATSTAVLLLVIHQCSVLAGILAIWFGADKMIAWFSNKEWFQTASSYSFFVFGLHVPLLPYMMKWALLHTMMLPNHRLLCYLVVPFVVICFCIAVGRLLHRYLPRFYSVVTGGRGF